MYPRGFSSNRRHVISNQRMLIRANLNRSNLLNLFRSLVRGGRSVDGRLWRRSSRSRGPLLDRVLVDDPLVGLLLALGKKSSTFFATRHSSITRRDAAPFAYSPFPLGACRSLTRFEQISGLSSGASMYTPDWRSESRSHTWPLGFMSSFSGDFSSWSPGADETGNFR